MGRQQRSLTLLYTCKQHQKNQVYPIVLYVFIYIYIVFLCFVPGLQLGVLQMAAAFAEKHRTRGPFGKPGLRSKPVEGVCCFCLFAFLVFFFFFFFLKFLAFLKGHPKWKMCPFFLDFSYGQVLGQRLLSKQGTPPKATKRVCGAH